MRLDELDGALAGMVRNARVARRIEPISAGNEVGTRLEIDGLAGQIITAKDIRPLRTEGKPVGYLYG